VCGLEGGQGVCLEKEGGGGSMSRRRGIGNLVMWVGSFGGGGGGVGWFVLICRGW